MEVKGSLGGGWKDITHRPLAKLPTLKKFRPATLFNLSLLSFLDATENGGRNLIRISTRGGAE